MPALPGIINDVLDTVNMNCTFSHRLMGLCHMLPCMVHATRGTPKVFNLLLSRDNSQPLKSLVMARLPLTEF